MTHKALFIDMDDTLLHTDNSISDKNLSALRDLSRRGVHVVLCSGRPSVSVRQYMPELFGMPGDAPESYYISFNGARVDRWDTGEELFRKGVPMDAVRDIVLFARREGIVVQLYKGDTFLAEKDSPEVRYYQKFSGMEYEIVDDLISYLDEESPKILFHAPAEKISAVYPAALEMSRGRFHLAFSKPIYLEIMNNEVNKAVAMTFLLDRLGISLNETIAVGDSMNDLEMIRAAGVGIVVANAREALKEEADVILTHRHDEDALFFVAESYF
jgi:Cof subfamily protein (haloacid dehalogenase superfamily)